MTLYFTITLKTLYFIFQTSLGIVYRIFDNENGSTLVIAFERIMLDDADG